MVEKITDKETLECIQDEIENAILGIMETYNVGSIDVRVKMNFQGDCFDGVATINHCYESGYEYPCRPHRER